jgi:hypothetical protein
MAHFAELDENNIVLRVIVVANDKCLDQNDVENESIGALFCHNLLDGHWIQTSYNAETNGIRGKFAGIGDFYDATTDKFYPADWTLVDGVWQAPPVEETEI